MAESKPIGEVLNGLTIRPLDDGYTPLDAAVVVKTIDEDGDICWVTRYTSGPHTIEFIGALHSALGGLTHQVEATFVPDEDDD